MMTDIALREEGKELTGWRGTLEKAMPNIANLLPKHVTQDKFRSVAANTIANNPDLRELMQSNPTSVINALVACASDGLVPNGREAAMVTFRGARGPQLQYIPMIAGVLKRMRQSGEVKSIRSRIVHEYDRFHIEYGDDEKFIHEPELENPGKPIGAYAIIEMADGFTYREFMSAGDIGKVKKAARAKAGPWAGDFEQEMWRKTVLKRAAKYCPFSSDIITMLDRDNTLYDLNQKVEDGPSLAERFQASQNAPEDDEPAEPIDMGDVQYADTERSEEPGPGFDPETDDPRYASARNARAQREKDGPDEPVEETPEPEVFPGDASKTPAEVAEALWKDLQKCKTFPAYKKLMGEAFNDGRFEIIEQDQKVKGRFFSHADKKREELQAKEESE